MIRSDSWDGYAPTTDLMRSYWKENTFDPENADKEFDTWLNQVRAEAWDEGLRLAVGGHPPHTVGVLFTCNPYKP